jgi:ATP-dependent RNA helicase RhlE
MLDMGFIHDVKRVLARLPAVRQTLLFSATVPPAVRGLAEGLLRRPVEISVTPEATTAETVRQSVHHVARSDKRALLERILKGDGAERVIVFTRTKHGANRLSDQLERAGIGSAAIHGNKSQGARERALEGFRAGTTQVLVATDIAARGIDVDAVSLVVNYDLPNVPESYVHRIGRTGRAGAVGAAVSFCDETERSLLVDIERMLRGRIPVASAGAQPSAVLASAPEPRVTLLAGASGPSSSSGARPRTGRRHFRPRTRR